MNELDQIDDYFANRLPAEARVRFEQTLKTDTAAAQAVAFYLLARQTAQAEARIRRKADFAQLSPTVRTGWWPYAAAAAACLLLIMGLGWFFWQPQPSAMALADGYIDQGLTTLSVNMGGPADSLQTGVQAFNAGQLVQAGAIFATIRQRNPHNDTALKLSGIVALRLNQYDQAIDLFHQLGQRSDLFANPGLFYEALARLKRGQPQDKSTAEALLKTVINKNLEGAETAKKWLYK